MSSRPYFTENAAYFFVLKKVLLMESCFSTLESRLEAFRKADLYPVISSEFCAGRDPFEIFCAAAEGGAKVIQIREKNWNKGEIHRLALRCREVANRFGVLIIIDDHVDVALTAGADGVHLGQEDLPIDEAKRIAPKLLLGSSTHNLEEILTAQRLGTGYLNIGPIFATQTKTVGIPPLGTELLKELIPHVTVPFSVMGGIKERHIPELSALGAARIAMVTEITQAPEPREKVRELRKLIG